MSLRHPVRRLHTLEEKKSREKEKRKGKRKRHREIEGNMLTLKQTWPHRHQSRAWLHY